MKYENLLLLLETTIVIYDFMERFDRLIVKIKMMENFYEKQLIFFVTFEYLWWQR